MKLSPNFFVKSPPNIHGHPGGRGKIEVDGSPPWKEGKWYVAKCVEVKVASQGKSKEEALANLSEALTLYFKGESVPKPPQFAGVELHFN